MNKTTKPREVERKITVTLPELQSMLCAGRHTAERIAHEAGAELKIGNRRLYHVGKIEEYLAASCEGGQK